MKYAKLPVEDLVPWAKLNNVQLNGIMTNSNFIDKHGINRGGCIVATDDHEENTILLKIPSDLILTRAQVLLHARSDKNLRDLLDALGDFTETPRKVILIFLLLQMTCSSPDLTARDIKVGMTSPLTDYFRTLPKQIPLPTFWAEDEQELSRGTSLHNALASKLRSLQREFEELKERTVGIGWCKEVWWGDASGLALEDWYLVDAMYRSRALDLPAGIGDAMVPVLDMANHEADDRCNARFEVDGEGDVVLLVREGRSVARDAEITINYGPGGACESIFSYGFLEEGVNSAREMFLPLSIPQDDPLGQAKLKFSEAMPGVRIFADHSGRMEWEGELVWWLCINEEDGLEFEVAQTVDGVRELQAVWKGHKLTTKEMSTLVLQDAVADVFKLRAIVTVLGLVEEQGIALAQSEDDFEKEAELSATSQQYTIDLIRRLRGLELELLGSAMQQFETQKEELMSTSVVRQYLSVGASEDIYDSNGNDFS